jgi:UDP-N-acetylglucosamine 2-epimerase (non-hydrolysing)
VAEVARTRHILCSAGTRPEVIKLAPLVQALARSDGLRVTVVDTGQHPDLVEPLYDLFGITPAHRLAIATPGASIDELVARTLLRVPEVLAAEAPDTVVVQGDTSSALACGLAAFHARIPLVHLEAGLRTASIDRPFPEEGNRRLLGRIASLHLAPTPRARQCLLAEGTPADRIVVTGNTVVDAIRWAADRAPEPDPDVAWLAAGEEGRVLVTLHRRESWGAPLRRAAEAIAAVAAARPATRVLAALHPNPAVREAVVPPLAALGNVRIVDPLPYAALAGALAGSTLVLTDSGGLQEEAPSFGVPVLVLRDETERTEGIDAGCAELVGCDPARIQARATDLLDARHRRPAANPYGDGRAAERAHAALRWSLGMGARPRDFEGTAL